MENTMTKPPLKHGLLASIFLVAVTAGESHAQTGISEDTLDAHVASADLIVRATVSAVDNENVRKPAANGWVRSTVTLKVLETIKGKPAETVTFGLGGYNLDGRYRGWKEAGTEGLWFLGRNPVFGATENFGEDEINARFPLQKQFQVRLGAPVEAEKIYTRPTPLFSVALEVLSDPKAILEATRASASYPSDRERAGAWSPPGESLPESHSLSIPVAIMARSGRFGDYNYLGMPIDRRLERLAKRMVTVPGDLLPPREAYPRVTGESGRRFDESQLRAEGAKALRYFKAPENIAILTPLLSDPASWHVTQAGDESDEGFREYYVRKAGYETLIAWGTAVVAPVIREPGAGQ